MQFRAFDYMIELERAGSFNKAATNLFISQQGLRKVIDALEVEMGSKLLERGHSGVKLTPAGELFVAHAKAIIREFQEIKNGLADMKAADGIERLGAIDLVVSPYVSLNLMRYAFTAIDTPVGSRIAEKNDGEIEHLLAAGAHGRLYLFDWLAHWGGGPLDEVLRSGKGLHIEELFESRIGLLCDASSKTAERASISVEEAVRLPLAVYGGDDYVSFVDRAIGESAFSGEALRISEQSTIDAFIRSTPDAAIILDDLSFRNSLISDMKAPVFVPIESDLVLRVGFVHFKDDPEQPLYERYVGDFRRACAKRFRSSFRK